MATGRLGAVVTPVPVGAPRHSLLTSVAVVNETDNRFENGIRWLPEQCLGGHVFDLCINSDDINTPIGMPGDTLGDSFGVAVTLECGTITSRTLDLEARARRFLAASESRLVANTLWNGLSVPDHFMNYLARDGDVDELNSGSATDPVRALADLETALAGCRNGGQGVIHASRQTATYWQHHNLLFKEGALLRTAFDTLVVADEGYDGSAPDGTDATAGNAWAYATGMVQVHRGPMQMIAPTETTQSEKNKMRVTAWRPFAVQFDPCCHIGINVDHCAADAACA